MGKVYRAHDPQLERDVAIKVLSAPGDPVKAELATVHTIDLREAATRTSSDDLLREARMMAKLSHPNVVPVYEVGLDGESVFVVMEHIDGADLRAWLAAKTRPPQAILAALAQAGQGLAAAHSRGIVHRDFKPDNVLIGSDGRARVADFGLSRLVAPGGMVRVAETGGTPAYMAPELWGGAPATMASDVYAFCVAVVEALGIDATDREELPRRLRERGVPVAARAEIVAGISEAPADRPDITRVVAALEGKKPGRRWVALGAGAVVLAGAGVAVLALRGDGAKACTIDRSLVTARWDGAVQTALRARFPEIDDKRWESLVSNVGGKVDAVLEKRRETCRAVQQGELTAAQGAKQAACLERRAIVVGARAKFYATAKQTDVDTAEEILRASADTSPCLEMNAPPLHPDRARVEALHLRAVAFVELSDTEAIEELRRIEREAGELDEAELEANTAITLGIKLRNQDKLTEASDAYQRAFKRAIAINSSSIAAIALVERSNVAGHSGDANAAKSLAELAIEQAEKPTATWRHRVRAYRQLSHAHLLRGEYKETIEWADKALELIKTEGRFGEFEIIIRLDKQNALNFQSDRDREALAFAKETVVRAKELVGTRNLNYAVALDLLARSYTFAEQPQETPRYRREALAVLQDLYPADHSRVVMQRAELGNDLMYTGQLDEARAELTAAVQISREKSALRSKLPFLTARLALITFEDGDHSEGLRQMVDAVAQLTSLQGIDHPQTTWFRSALVDMRFEVGQLEEAERGFAPLEASYRNNSLPEDRRPAGMNTRRARLLLERGQAQAAEEMARKALAGLEAVNATPFERRGPQAMIVEALLAQKRFAEAHPIATTLLAIVQENNERADEVALWELRLARAEHGLGKRAEGIARAEKASAVLEKWPGQVRWRRAAAPLVKTQSSSISGPGRKP
jgi:tetratricopeptide (TPR) repeat protein